MAFWPFGKKKQQDEAAAESTPLAPTTEGLAAEPAGGPETGREVESGAGAELVEKQVLIDGRNVLPVTEWQNAGWQLRALGRSLGDN